MGVEFLIEARPFLLQFVPGTKQRKLNAHATQQIMRCEGLRQEIRSCCCVPSASGTSRIVCFEPHHGKTTPDGELAEFLPDVVFIHAGSRDVGNQQVEGSRTEKLEADTGPIGECHVQRSFTGEMPAEQSEFGGLAYDDENPPCVYVHEMRV